MRKIREEELNILKTISKEEKQKRLEEAPEEVQTASDALKDAWVLYNIADKNLKTNPNRFFAFRGKEDEDEILDLLHANYKGMIRLRGGSMQDVADAEEIKNKIIVPLMRKMQTAKRFYDCKYKAEGISEFPAEIRKELIELYATMNTHSSVIKILKEKGIKASTKELMLFLSRNKAEIDAKKAVFLATSKEYKVATEAGRLSILNDILTDLQLKYERYREENEKKALVFLKEIRNVLEQARKEVKGNDIKLTVDGKIDINATLHGMDNVDRTMRSLPINALVIGIVAAKSNLDPTILIHQLATSYYKDLNGFNKNILGREAIMLPGDLIRGMDWKETQEQNMKFLNEMRPPKVEEATYEEITLKESVKERLRKLKMQQKE